MERQRERERARDREIHRHKREGESHAETEGWKQEERRNVVWWSGEKGKKLSVMLPV